MDEELKLDDDTSEQVHGIVERAVISAPIMQTATLVDLRDTPEVVETKTFTVAELIAKFENPPQFKLERKPIITGFSRENPGYLVAPVCWQYGGLLWTQSMIVVFVYSLFLYS